MKLREHRKRVNKMLLGVPVPASGKKRGKQNPEQWEVGDRTTQVATATRWKTHPSSKRGRTADPTFINRRSKTASRVFRHRAGFWVFTTILGRPLRRIETPLLTCPSVGQLKEGGRCVRDAAPRPNNGCNGITVTVTVNKIRWTYALANCSLSSSFVLVNENRLLLFPPEVLPLPFTDPVDVNDLLRPEDAMNTSSDAETKKHFANQLLRRSRCICIHHKKSTNF